MALLQVTPTDNRDQYAAEVATILRQELKRRGLFRWCSDIGMFAWDRARWSCSFRTEFCAETCFNCKFYQMYPEMAPCDAKLEGKWLETTGETVKAELARKRKQTKRVRGCTRGETFSAMGDVQKVYHILKENHRSLFWLPTRGWRDPSMRDAIESIIAPMPNARLCASLDPSNTAAEWASVKASGWSTLFYGDNERTHTPNGDPLFRCPKTWAHVKGACASCNKACFSLDRTDAILKQH